jgi:hypothetical protein
MKSGAKGVVSSPVDMHLADGCALTKHRKCQVFVPSPLQACPSHGHWATCIRLSHAKAESEFPTLSNEDLSAKEENHNRRA